MTTPNSQQKSFFASLFDFQFTSFITLRFLKVIYAILVGLILITGVLLLIVGLASGSASGILFGIILAPLLTLLYLIVARIYLEVIAMFFRIGDNTALAVQLLSRGNQGQPGFGPSPGPGAPWGGPSGGAAFGPPLTTPYGQPTSGYGQPAEPPSTPYGQQGHAAEPAEPPSTPYSQPGHAAEPPADSSGQQDWGPPPPSQ